MLTKIQGKIVIKVRPFQMPVIPDGTGFKVDPGESRPVFLLTFADRSQRVLKGEITDQSGNEGAEFIASLQSVVGADLGVLILSPEDIAELADMRKDIIHNGAGRHPHAATINAFIKDMATSNMFIFYTMTFVSDLKSLESQAHQTKKNGDERALDKMGVVKLARRMVQDRTLLPALGKVVAVDIFCGNADRFGPDGKIVNSGNILFRKNLDKTYTPVGIDFFDVQGEFSKMTTPLLPGQMVNWPGLMLSAGNAQQLAAFASKAMMSLNASFRASMGGRTMPSDAVLGAMEVNAFKSGLAAGAAELRAHLLGMVGRLAHLPAGVQSRMDLLGWQRWIAAGARPPVAPQRPTGLPPGRPLGPYTS